jgi:hypothetical protein
MSWQREEEQLLASIGDRCNGYQWLHTQSQVFYDQVNFWLTVPNIVISAAAGSATIGLTSLFGTADQTVATTVIGSVTILAGVLTTINQYVNSSQLAESHRNAALYYGKLYRLILTQLSLRREQREPAHDFLQLVRSEQDRLQDISPSISQMIITRFNSMVGDNKSLQRPEVTGDLDHIVISPSPPLGLAIDIRSPLLPITPVTQ